MNHPELATPGHPAASPAGDFVLAVREVEDRGHPALRFEIRRQSGEAVFAPPEVFAARHRTYFLWDPDGRVWVYSGDKGTFFWERVDDTHWKQQAYADSNVPAPPFLQQTMPRWFQR